MIVRRQDMCLTLDASEPLKVVCKCCREQLQSDIASELRIPRAVDLTHAAGAKYGQDFVRAEARPDRKGQLLPWIIRAGGSDSSARSASWPESRHGPASWSELLRLEIDRPSVQS